MRGAVIKSDATLATTAALCATECLGAAACLAFHWSQALKVCALKKQRATLSNTAVGNAWQRKYTWYNKRVPTPVWGTTTVRTVATTAAPATVPTGTTTTTTTVCVDAPECTSGDPALCGDSTAKGAGFRSLCPKLCRRCATTPEATASTTRATTTTAATRATLGSTASLANNCAGLADVPDPCDRLTADQCDPAFTMPSVARLTRLLCPVLCGLCPAGATAAAAPTTASATPTTVVVLEAMAPPASACEASCADTGLPICVAKMAAGADDNGSLERDMEREPYPSFCHMHCDVGGAAPAPLALPCSRFCRGQTDPAVCATPALACSSSLTRRVCPVLCSSC